MEHRVKFGRRYYRRFIHYPSDVDDGTCRCIRCGQIDEPDVHDDELCGPTPAAQSFILANRKSLVVEGYVNSLSEGGATFRLANKKTFIMTAADCQSMPSPRWKGHD